MAVKVVPKVWGKERIVAQEPDYTGKILVLNKGAGSSEHRHPLKKETMVCLKGLVRLVLWVTPGTHPVTILPGQWHQFHGLEDSEILEVSTYDDPDDVERRTDSYAGGLGL